MKVYIIFQKQARVKVHVSEEGKVIMCKLMPFLRNKTIVEVLQYCSNHGLVVKELIQ